MIALFAGLFLTILNAIYLYMNIKEIRDHIKTYHEHKTNKTLKSWYLEWPEVLLDTLLVNSPNAIISLITFLIGLFMVIDTIKELLY
jgi:hypothetical protein